MVRGTGRGTGNGKVILLGEHAVVYGHAALAGALALGVDAEARPAGKSRLVVPAWGIDTAADPQGAPARALAAMVRAMGGRAAAQAAVHAIATVPSRAGLGSSAALAVAVTRALAPDLRDDEVEQVAGVGEDVFHGNPSGVDVALATRGGIGLYRRGVGLERIAAMPFRLAIGLSGEPRDTAARVADVARQRAADPGRVEPILTELGELAEQGVAALRGSDAARLGLLFDRAHERLARLQLSTPALDRLCEVARGAGAAGAKLTGAGGGGAVIAAGSEDAVVAAWQEAGFAAMVAVVG